VDWLVVASVRGVKALRAGGLRQWPGGLRSAAVGPRTAEALSALGATPAPLVGAREGAEGLWSAMEAAAEWPGTHTMVVTTPGGRTLLSERLRAAGAVVDEVEAYAMAPRPAEDIREDWGRVPLHAAVVTSPRSARHLAAAVGVEALGELRAIVAIGDSTAEALRSLGLVAHVPPIADLAAAAQLLATLSGAATAGGDRI